MTHLKLARPSHPDKLARTRSAASHLAVAPILAAILARAAATGALPAPQTEKHPVNWLPEPVEDQGQTGECTAHALSQGLAGSCGARGINLGFEGPPSPKHFYSCSGAIARAAATPIGKPPALQDDGRELADEITALMTCGAVKMGALASDGRFSDATPENATDEPSIQAVEAGVHDCLSGAHTNDLSAAGALDIAAASLDAGIALFVGFSCGDTFENLTATDIAGPTPATDPNQGGHAIVVVSYRINAAGEREWLIRNSWGPAWALSGGAWCTSAFVLALWEMWLLEESLLPAAKEAA